MWDMQQEDLQASRKRRPTSETWKRYFHSCRKKQGLVWANESQSGDDRKRPSTWWAGLVPWSLLLPWVILVLLGLWRPGGDPCVISICICGKAR